MTRELCGGVLCGRVVSGAGEVVIHGEVEAFGWRFHAAEVAYEASRVLAVGALSCWRSPRGEPHREPPGPGRRPAVGGAAVAAAAVPALLGQEQEAGGALRRTPAAQLSRSAPQLPRTKLWIIEQPAEQREAPRTCPASGIVPGVDVIALATLDDQQAAEVVGDLLNELATTRDEVDTLSRRIVGIRKLIDGLIEMYPATEDLLPPDLDDDEQLRPRGAEAVRRVLEDRPTHWHAVPTVVDRLDAWGWTPESSNPPNAVRSALQRLVDQGLADKGRSAEDGAVVYRLKPRSAPDMDGEPF